MSYLRNNSMTMGHGLKGSVITVNNNNNNISKNNFQHGNAAHKIGGRNNSISDILLGKPHPHLTFVDTSYGHNKNNNGGGIINNISGYNQRFFENEGLYKEFRGFLIFGKCIGLIPLEGLFQKDVDQVVFRKKSIASIINIVITLLLAVNAAAGIISIAKFQGKNAAEFAWSPAPFVFYAQGTFIYIYIYRNSGNFLEIFRKWSRLELSYTLKDKTLSRDIGLIAGLILTSAILENAFAHIKLFPVVAQSEIIKSGVERANASALEIYTARSHPIWLHLVPYHPVLAIYVFTTNKLSLYAWNYMDITIALFARAIYFKFKALYIQGDAVLVAGNASNSYDIHRWRQLCADHATLCTILEQMSRFVSPLVFMSFAVNIYYICLQLNLGLTPAANTSTIASIYAVWSFVHLIVRVYVVSLTSARINDWAHKVSSIFQKCPNEAYIVDVERTERYVSVNAIGFTGIGCFTLTKPFILQIVSVVFTFEIVLLQAAQTTL